MEGSKAQPSQSRAWWVLILTVGLLQTPMMVQAMVVDPSASLSEGMDTNLRGQSVLVEELTATWCASCAEIDPFLMGVADAHGSRITMVAYHPSDGEDAFAPPAAQHRIERLRTVNPELPGTPTFLVEGGAYRTGPDQWVEVQRDILDSEVERQTHTKMQLNIQSSNQTITASLIGFDGRAMNTTQLTFMVLEHEKTVPKDAINPGGATRDRVVVATAECDIGSGTIITEICLINASAPNSCTDDFSIVFEAMDTFSVVMIHENTLEKVAENGDLSTYGALEFAYRERSEPESWDPAWAVLLGAATIGLLVFRKNEPNANDSEE
jgi:thiol-disulfide isomerase/thioredoxin